MTTFSQKNFSAGELTPALHSRVDSVKYATGLRTCRNARVLKTGGVENRTGTEFIGATPVGAGNTIRLIDFVYDDTAAFVIIMRSNKLHFKKNGEYKSFFLIY
jgi:hypothetical protein